MENTKPDSTVRTAEKIAARKRWLQYLLFWLTYWVTWAAADNSSLVVGVIGTTVDQIAGFIPHAQFAHVRQSQRNSTYIFTDT